VAVIQECAEPEILRSKMGLFAADADPVWIGSNPHKGLAVFAFNGCRARLDETYDPSLRFIAPVRIEGPERFDLLAVWAQNANDGILRKAIAGPLADGIVRYHDLIAGRRAFVVGDFNNSVFWDKPGWAMNHALAVAALAERGLVSAYHAVRGECQGAEVTPTHYWRDRTKDGPTYHIDYIFVPRDGVADIREMTVGDFESWCGNKLSDHVPLTVEIDW
jgi:hypothetical protein